MGQRGPARVVIADDHRIVREGVCLLLSDEDDLVVVGEVDDGEALLEMLASGDVDLVILDLRMPGVNGLDVLPRLKARHPALRVLVLTMYDDPMFVRRAIELGADGYVLKSAAREELMRAIRSVLAGNPYLQGDVTGPLVKRMVGRRRDDAFLDSDDVRLLRLVADGLDNREIARELGLTEGAVKARLRSVFTRLDVKSRAEAVAVAFRIGLLD